MKAIENVFTQNRAEEFGYDLWESFVVPPFYGQLDLLTARKPRVIVGGRGCGKTSLLRYLCHQTQFSNKRTDITKDDILNIGIYWRVDTQFAKMLSKRGMDELTWQSAFIHLAVLEMSYQVLKSLESIGNSTFEFLEKIQLDHIEYSGLDSFFKEIPKEYRNLLIFIKEGLHYFKTWIGNIRTLPEPVFLPLDFLKYLIDQVRGNSEVFRDTCYLVYIDEYENLLEDQKRVINTWIKHSEYPLIFNLAMKPNSFLIKETIGNEKIAATHDYRECNLETYYMDSDFEAFAAEILLQRLLKDETQSVPIVKSADLISTKEVMLTKRQSKEYRDIVKGYASEFFPPKSHPEISEEIFKDGVLNNRLYKLIEGVLSDKGIKYEIDKLLFKDFPQAGVIVPALLSRGESISTLMDEVGKLREGKENRFKEGNWIHNYILGCILIIYEPLGRVCPIYSGFDTFCLMSRTNIRHFLELCYKTVVNENLYNLSTKIRVMSCESQAEAAKHVSSTFLTEVKNFGSDGNRIYQFVLRIGTYFKYAQMELSQSEPEQNHFSIKGDPSEEIRSFIEEAVKWSVLYVDRITKQKGGKNKAESEDFEYILNPIYAPYFHISYRKKRRVELSAEVLELMINGTKDDYNRYLTSMAKSLSQSGRNSTINLYNPSDT